MNAWKLGEMFSKVSPPDVAAMGRASGERMVTPEAHLIVGMLPSKNRPDGVDSFGEPFWMEMDWNDAARVSSTSS